ncbi:MFS transporter [Allokutzneria sp. A3M-2-11 16]|uniref:MFS transporter n=1 Tax=Allokutzneria sp. A3M-2-11 16 TaxID=2962043 RepID=UPI0020B88F47|nr:MFS transporter [Allokutzneria sp. A3M-2-11 16]MCP3803624.1 MFS transporter [Allokutzneria sp. A3M-2-11 16]
MRQGNGVFGLLAVAASWGLFWGGWAALIPEIKADLVLTDQQLGLALFAVPVAAVPSMVLTGRLAQRLAQHTLPVVTGVFALGVLLVGLSGSQLAFTASLLLVGAASGAIEVALNATMAAREARDGERLFNKVHAATPLAMVVAAPCVGLARQLGASSLAVLVVIAVLVGLSAIMAIDPAGWREKAGHTGSQAGPRQFYTPLLLVGAVAAMVLLMENAVEQWGAIHLEQELAAGPLLASFGPAAYMAGLSAGRLLAQWQGAALGDRTLVISGGALGLVGLVVGAAAWSPATTLIGFAVAGIGLAPVVPTLMGAVGRAVAHDQRSKAISLVTTVGYAGFLSSPPLVGTLAGWLGLPTVLMIVALFGLVVMAGAAALRLLPTPARTA